MKTDYMLAILLLLSKEKLTISQITPQIDLSESRLYVYLQNLCKQGLINKFGKCYELSELTKELLTNGLDRV